MAEERRQRPTRRNDGGARGGKRPPRQGDWKRPAEKQEPRSEAQARYDGPPLPAGFAPGIDVQVSIVSPPSHSLSPSLESGGWHSLAVPQRRGLAPSAAAPHAVSVGAMVAHRDIPYRDRWAPFCCRSTAISTSVSPSWAAASIGRARARAHGFTS